MNQRAWPIAGGHDKNGHATILPGPIIPSCMTDLPFGIVLSMRKTKNAFMALAFTALVAAELILLLWTLSRHPAVNLGAWPGFDSAAGLACVAFHAGIGGILGLYLLFWARLNILQTLPLLAVLGLFTAVSGNRALLALADARAKAS